MSRLFCFGLGFTARQIVMDFPDWDFLGTGRSVPEAGREGTIPLYSFRRDCTLANFQDIAKDVSHVLLSVPPDKLGDPVCDVMAEQILALPALEWIGYLSTTGVYGDLQGGWVDEESPRDPTGARGARRVQAEMAWQELQRRHDLPLHIFRLPGIYGPGRNQLVSMKSGKARRIVKQGQVFSRIHVADLAAILMASMKKPAPGEIYNVADDEPAPPDEVVTYAASLLGMTPPPLQPFETADLSPMARSFYADSKRVSNAKIKAELGISLKYPTYREGLAALL
ncbi:SDR family oxidoreductase [Sneathiella sp.]|uniref:SDR family oxidoreductase n=1 Tax=Sneathiella sp. TaxID=1964365 RepID=UPI0035671A2E